MKKIQLISIIVTGVVIIAVGVVGVATNAVSKKLLGDDTENLSSKVEKYISDAASSDVELPEEDLFGVINIVGEIGASSSLSLTSDSSYNHELYLNYIDEMIDSDDNKGILLYVDSPGGAVYQSDELYQKIMEYKKKTAPTQGSVPRHHCVICGRTDVDSPQVEFRYCSKCEGNYEYCSEHLFTHEHVHH